MSHPAAADNSLLVSREQARNKIGSALRLFVGRGRRYSVKQLSNGTGVPDWQINAALIDGGSTDNRPLPPEALLSVMLFLGADFTNEWMPLARQGAFELPDDDPDPGRLAADSTEDSAAIARAAADGKFDVSERPDLKIVGARMVARGTQLVALASVKPKHPDLFESAAA